MRVIPSERSSFPLIKHSDGINRLLLQLIPLRTSVIPLYLGPNGLELRAFVQELCQLRRMDNKILIVRRGMTVPSILELQDDSPDCVVFMDGDRIPEWFQHRLCVHRLAHVQLVFAIISEEASRHPAKDTALGRQMLNWTDTFADRSSCPFRWPAWSLRRSDHSDLIVAMYRKLNMPQGKTKPALHRSAADYLLSQSFTGTDTVEAELKRGFSNYIKQDDEGDLKAEHFINSQMLCALSSARRDVRLDDPQQ